MPMTLPIFMLNFDRYSVNTINDFNADKKYTLTANNYKYIPAFYRTFP